MVSWKHGIRQKICSGWLNLGGFLIFCEAATEGKLSSEIFTQGNICRAFFKLKMKLVLLHPELMLTQVWLDGKGDPAVQDHKPTDALLSSTDTNMELARCHSVQSGHETWVWESLHCSLPTFILTPVWMAWRWASLFPSRWASKDARRRGSKKRESIVSTLSCIPSTTAPLPMSQQPELALKWVGRGHKPEPEHVLLWVNLCPASCRYGHRSPGRKTHLLKLHCSLEG